MRLNKIQASEETAEVQISELENTDIKISAIAQALEDVTSEKENLEGLIRTLQVCKDDLNQHRIKLLEDRIALMSLVGNN